MSAARLNLSALCVRSLGGSGYSLARPDLDPPDSYSAIQASYRDFLVQISKYLEGVSVLPLTAAHQGARQGRPWAENSLSY
jgi:hypothetical protein